jgi:hypothetical protein
MTVFFGLFNLWVMLNQHNDNSWRFMSKWPDDCQTRAESLNRDDGYGQYYACQPDGWLPPRAKR